MHHIEDISTKFCRRFRNYQKSVDFRKIQVQDILLGMAKSCTHGGKLGCSRLGLKIRLFLSEKVIATSEHQRTDGKLRKM